MTGSLGLVIEVMVGGLLAVTIGYCVMLDKRLRAVRQDELVMRKTVTDLGVAAERAERAIAALRNTLGDCDRTLGERLRVAEQYTTDLEEQIRSGDDILTRISRIVHTALDTPASANYDPATAYTADVNRLTPSRINQTLAAAQALAKQMQARMGEGKRDNVA